MSLHDKERRSTRRHRTSLAIRVLLLVTRRSPGEEESVLTCSGYTHDISESGLALVVSAKSINESFLERQTCTMQIVLTLPVGPVEINAVPVRYERLSEAKGQDGAQTEKGFLVGVRILEIAESGRARYLHYLKELLQPTESL